MADAARKAEARTSAEIVPYLVDQCDSYDGSCWKAAAAGALIFSLAAGAIHDLAGIWGGSGLAWVALPGMAGLGLGYTLARFVPRVRHTLTDPRVLTARAWKRAQVAFLEEEVFRTRARTGILLFVARFERRVVVLGDSGVNAKVEKAAWEGIASRLASEIKQDRICPGLIEAIESCGTLLEANGLAHPADDVNELPDDLRQRDR